MSATTEDLQRMSDGPSPSNWRDGPAARRASGKTKVCASSDGESHAIAAQESVIGALLIGGKWSAVAAIVRAEDYTAQHGLIVAAIATLAAHEEPHDALTVSQQLERTGHLAAAGGLAYLSELARNTLTVENVAAYARAVCEHAIKRRLPEGHRNSESIDRLRRNLADLDAVQKPAVPEENPFRVAPVDFTWLTEAPPEQPFLLDKIAPAGGVTLFAAQSGTGKSTLAIDAVIAVATGYSWLDFAPPQGAVGIYYALEDAADVARRRVYHIARRRREQVRQVYGVRAAAEFDEAIRTRLYVRSLLDFDIQLVAEQAGLVIRTSQAEHLRQAVVELAAGRPTLLALDPLLNLHSADANAEAVGKALIRTLAGITQAAPCIAALVPAHTSKQAIRDGDLSAVSVRGSMALVDVARSVIVAGRIEGSEEIRKLFDASQISDAELPKANVVKILHAKSNYGAAAAPVYAMFRSGAFDALKVNATAGTLYQRRLAQWREWFRSPNGKPKSRRALTETLRGTIWPGVAKRDVQAFLEEAVENTDADVFMAEVKKGQSAELLRPMGTKND